MSRIFSDNTWKKIALTIVDGLDAAEYVTTTDPRDAVDGVLLQELAKDCDTCFKAMEAEDWGRLRTEMTVLLATFRVLLRSRGDELVPVYSALCVADGWVRWIAGEGE